jgi:hypothetical protein
MLKKTPIYLGINLTKEIRVLYNKSYKTVNNELEEDIRRWNYLPCS